MHQMDWLNARCFHVDDNHRRQLHRSLLPRRFFSRINRKKMNSKNSYDRHAEHQDRTSLGKLRSKYWTTKQLVIKKLGREEDEFVIASDADVDAKLELMLTIKQSCNDLLRVGLVVSLSFIQHSSFS